MEMSRLPRFAANVNYDAYIQRPPGPLCPSTTAPTTTRACWMAPPTKQSRRSRAPTWSARTSPAPERHELADRHACPAPRWDLHGRARSRADEDANGHRHHLELATLLQLAASDELRLQIWFSEADGYATPLDFCLSWMTPVERYRAVFSDTQGPPRSVATGARAQRTSRSACHRPFGTWTAAQSR